MAGVVLGTLGAIPTTLQRQRRLLPWMMPMFALMLGPGLAKGDHLQNGIPRFPECQDVFVGSFAVVSMQTGELIQSPKDD